MKTTVRIPCKEPYAYLEVTVDGTAEEAVATYNHYKQALEQSPEDRRTLTNFYDLLTKIFDSDMSKWGVSDDYASLTEQQKTVVQSVKRFYKRLQNGKRDLEADCDNPEE